MKKGKYIDYLVRLACLTLLSLMSIAALGQAIIWQEDFSLPDGTTSDPFPPSVWTIDISQTILAPGDYFEVRSAQQEGRDLDGEAIWISEMIDVTPYSDVVIMLDVSEAGRMESSDYLRAFYSIDGSDPILIGEVTNDIQGGGPLILSTAKINGRSLQIKICVMTNGGNERFMFDNVMVVAPAPVYSISNGNWDDVTKWSYTENGPDCNCMPSIVLPATITSGTTIDFDSSFDLQDLTIRDGGTARWVTAGRMTVKNEGRIRIENGGVLDNNGFSPDIFFEGNATVELLNPTNSFVADEIRTYGNVDFSGEGQLSARIFRVFGTGNLVTNNLVNGLQTTANLQFEGSSNGSQFISNSSIQVGGDIRMNGSNATFVNNSSIALNDDIVVVNNSDINNSFINNGTLSFNQLRLGNALGFYLENNGTLTMSDDFLALPTENQIVNAAGGILNYGGNGPDTDVRLVADAPNNTVTYTRAGVAPIITPQSGYWNLQIGGSNTKTAQANLDILGDLGVTSTFDANGFDVDLKGDLVNGGTMINSGNTFTLSGVDQSITSGINAFNHFTLSGGGLKLMQDNIIVSGNLTNAAIIDFSAPGQTITLGGNWMNNGTLSNKDETILFNGTSDQYIEGNTSFSNLILNKSGGRVLIESTIDLIGELSIQSATEFDVDGVENDQEFVLKSSLNSDSRIASLPVGASISGNLTAQRYLPAYGSKRWRSISSTVLNATVSDLQNEIPISGNFAGSNNGENGIPSYAKASLAYYDNSVGDASNTLDDRWVDYPTTTNAAEITDGSSPGRGFILWIRDTDDVTFDLRGPVNQGSIDFAPTGANERWNLLGNPYPSAIDWDGPGWAKTGIQGNAIHIWDGQNYRTWNGVIGSLGTGIISKGQSFWIQGSQDNITLQATESVKASASTAFLRNEKETYPYLELTVTTGEWQDKTYLALVEGAERSFDPFDANKLKNSVFNLSTASEEGVPLSINAVEVLECGSEIPMYLRDAWVGSYLMQWENLESISGALSLTIRDSYLDVMVDLSSSTSYSFDVTEDPFSFGDDRFKISIGPVQLAPALDLTGTQNCETMNPQITIADSQAGVKYEVYSEDGAILAAAYGTGGVLTFPFEDVSAEHGVINYTVRSIVEGCNSQSASEQVEIEIFGAPVLSYLPSQQVMYVNTEGSIQWYLDEDPIAGETNNSLPLGQYSGQIYALVSIGECTYQTETSIITAADDEELEGIEIFPNPFTDHFTINAENQAEFERFDIIGLNGATVYSGQISLGQNYIDASTLKTGNYIIKISGIDRSHYLKIIKK